MNPDQLFTALLTFAGTALVTGTGFWQWRRSHLRQERSEYRAGRTAALREIWEALSSAEADHRLSLQFSDREAAESLRQRITEVNLLILKNSPFLLPDEQLMSQRFTQLLTEVNALYRAGPRYSQEAVEWASSRNIEPGETLTSQAAGELEILRRQLADRYRAVVRGDME